MPDPQKIDAGAAWQVARNGLGRLACAVMDPADPSHDHAAECLTDDHARAADAMLRLLAAAVGGDEDTALDRLTELMASLQQPE